MKRSFIFQISLVLLTATFLLTAIPQARAQAGGDVRRRTIAITYFRDEVKVDMGGTTLRPEAKGEAKVERWRKRNTSEIDIRVENLIPAFNYGADYNTYVLWAITPAGQVDNLGEFRLSGGSARLKTATAHQTFALIVTAEPHYLVRLPSRMVVLENRTPATNKVEVQATEIFFTGDSGRYYTDSSVPAMAERDYNKVPMELLQARRAVQIARLADGERYDPVDYKDAVRALERAEVAYRQGANVHEVGRIARDSITLAVKARDISEERATAAARRAEIARRDEDVRRATENASDLQEELSETRTRLQASELSRTNTEGQLNRALRDAADARAEIRQLQSENDRLRNEIARQDRDLASARTRISQLESQSSNAATSLNAANTRLEEMERAERERREAETRRREFEELQASISGIVKVKPSENGFIAVLPDNFFVANQTSLALKVKAKMESLGQVLGAHPKWMFTIEGHSDPRSAAEAFALGRAQAVADYIAAFGVPKSNMRVESRGASVPLSSKRTRAGRALNRRVEIVFIAPR